jgi:integrase
MNNPLTNLDDLQYLLAILQEEGKKMVGKIRTNEGCPVCQQPFSHIPKVGYVCISHRTVPKRVYLDLHHQGQRIRIFSDKQGQVLDPYQRGLNLQAKITYEIENHSFDPSKYIRQEAEKFWVTNLLDQFQAFKLPSIAPSYQKDYRRMIKVAKEFFQTKDVRDLRKLDLINYKDYMEKKFSIKPKTVKNFLGLFRTFLRWCKNDAEVIENYPAFPEVYVPEPKFKWLDQEDQSALFEMVPTEDRPIISFLMLHGVRPGEARALKIKDVDLKNRTVAISATFSGDIYRQRRKGRKAKPYTLPLHQECYHHVAERVKNNLPEAWVFANPRTGNAYSENSLLRVWDTVRKKARISRDIRLYDASRHSVASQLRNAGVSLQDIKDQLGHSDIRTTEKYAHGSLKSLRTNLQKLSLKKVVPIGETVSGVSVEAK